MKKFVNVLGESITRLFLFGLGLLSKTTKRRAKRILFIGSINNVLIKAGIMEARSVENICKDILKLRSTDALQISQSLAVGLWDSDAIKDIVVSQHKLARGNKVHLTLNEAMAVTDKVIDISPIWLRYEASIMRRDIMEMFLYNTVKSNRGVL